ncbi:MAG: Asp-tRNA(Asn)/Glu-tRNA(Gln) amidotransferase subunit GatA [Spirochaetia bacterium]|nr:Asp-tRNA(Asn)/Glu-tRNA(Gln) amidotransferase subunit GatA [Spirochaetia bacterium]
MASSILNDLSKKIQKKEISPVELLNGYLKQIDRHDSKINAFIEVDREQALEAARESEKRIQAGKSLSPYDGIPVGIKDNIVVKGRRSTCASKILEGFISPYSATVVDKLTNQGMIPMGRLNMDEFAMGSSTENSAFKKTCNPYDLERAPGGSSGGSAAAIAADYLPVTLGSDTGGSIRQPAAFTGIVGLKPTYGTVSRYGLIAFASSLDQIGPFTRYASDNEIMYNIMKGPDSKDATSIPESMYKIPSYDMKSLKIGVPRELLEGLSPEVKKSFDQVLDFLAKEVVSKDQIVDVDLPHQKYGIAVYYLTATSEASANLARFDGVRYGNRVKDIKDLNELYEKNRTHGFGPEVKRRILLGTYALSSGYYDAFYGKAQKTRTLIKQDYLTAFEKMDVILMPTAPSVPFKIGEKTSNPVEMYLSDVLTVGASLAGIPAISVPGPFEKLPVGIQIQGNYFSEKLIYELSKKIQTAFPSPMPVLA